MFLDLSLFGGDVALDAFWIDRLEPVAYQIENEYPDAVTFGADAGS